MNESVNWILSRLRWDLNPWRHMQSNVWPIWLAIVALTALVWNW